MRTAFVLSGGASLGAVQVGMLQALVEWGACPGFVVGTSVGAVNGAWVAGHPGTGGADGLAAIWRSLRRADVFPSSPLRALTAVTGRSRAVVSPDGLRHLLSAQIPFQRLEDAPVPLHVVVADVLTGKDVLVSAGPAVDAVMASAAIPGIYPPVEIGDAAAWMAARSTTRREPQHFLYSKLMCWVALDRAIDLAGWLKASDPIGEWKRSREQIRAAIEQHGWNERVGAFTQAFGSDQLDAAALMISITGFLPATDPRMRATIDAIQRHLTGPSGLVYRYRRADDGVTGPEGTFLLCTFWLARCLALAGDTAQARAVFEAAAGCANDVGLLAEEADPGTGELLGNFPQAFSHIGLINAVWTILHAEEATRPSAGRIAAPA